MLFISAMVENYLVERNGVAHKRATRSNSRFAFGVNAQLPVQGWLNGPQRLLLIQTTFKQ